MDSMNIFLNDNPFSLPHMHAQSQGELMAPSLASQGIAYRAGVCWLIHGHSAYS